MKERALIWISFLNLKIFSTNEKYSACHLSFQTSLATKRLQKLEIDMFYAALVDNSLSCNFLLSLKLS